MRKKEEGKEKGSRRNWRIEKGVFSGMHERKKKMEGG